MLATASCMELPLQALLSKAFASFVAEASILQQIIRKPQPSLQSNYPTPAMVADQAIQDQISSKPRCTLNPSVAKTSCFCYAFFLVILRLFFGFFMPFYGRGKWPFLEKRSSTGNYGRGSQIYGRGGLIYGRGNLDLLAWDLDFTGVGARFTAVGPDNSGHGLENVVASPPRILKTM